VAPTPHLCLPCWFSTVQGEIDYYGMTKNLHETRSSSSGAAYGEQVLLLHMEYAIEERLIQLTTYTHQLLDGSRSLERL
jgi:hypothetical protein